MKNEQILAIIKQMQDNGNGFITKEGEKQLKELNALVVR